MHSLGVFVKWKIVILTFCFLNQHSITNACMFFFVYTDPSADASKLLHSCREVWKYTHHKIFWGPPNNSERWEKGICSCHMPLYYFLPFLSLVFSENFMLFFIGTICSHGKYVLHRIKNSSPLWPEGVNSREIYRWR